MSYRLAVVGLGDIRKQDKGLTIYLLEKLKTIFSEKLDISFINGGADGEDLFNTLQNIKAEKIVILDTMREIIKPGELDYLIIRPTESKSLKELLMVTIGIFSDSWGKKLSTALCDKFYDILNKVTNIIKELLN
ncbi:hydrogenase maturation protease [Orenia metallireducens]|jgi:hydrogenase maturation protease|uniref:Hydrogenase maturation protease n=1 Tax=Orenia metallireducens TaxID=1413210 RepID=A0A285IKX9_9FIRM|nr:hypothetical protein [Orenia metallireducens]PRX17211.1 hydrogenase maturation protease [Orenia metallireducens]SNY47641.1 hydrogenase maturation protease [Orenia metallireducens]